MPSRNSLFWRLSFAVLPIVVACVGCRLLDRSQISGTLAYRQQIEEITRIAPYGTPRAKAVASLEKAGVVGEYSRAGQSVYYCHFWDRKGKRWHMTVSLLFNTKDEFYAVNLADADIKQDPNEPPADANAPGKASLTPSRNSAPQRAVPWPDDNRDSAPGFPGPKLTEPRAGRRTPFDEDSR